MKRFLKYKYRLKWREQLYTKNRTRRHFKRKRKQRHIRKAAEQAKLLESRVARSKHETVSAPEVFSFVTNTTDTLAFFNKIENLLLDAYPIKIDLSKVTEMSADSLLYLLALFDRLNKSRKMYHVEGNIPKHKTAADKFRHSGFLKYVTANGVQSHTSKNIVQIYGGEKIETRIVKDLVKLTHTTLGLNKYQTMHLYEVLIEIINNTVHHAYRSKDILPKWYAYAEYNELERSVVFTVLDTGLGIPATVRRTWGEVLIDSVRVRRMTDSQLIISALDGKFRTQTNKRYRGRGLPKIKSAHEDGSLTDLLLISRKGYINLSSGTHQDLGVTFRGTLYTWKVVAQ